MGPRTVLFLNDPGPIKINLRPAHSTSSWNTNYDLRGCKATRQGREPSSLGMTAFRRTPLYLRCYP